MIHVYSDLVFFDKVKEMRNSYFNDYNPPPIYTRLQNLLSFLLRGKKKLILCKADEISPGTSELLRVLMDQHVQGLITLKLVSKEQFTHAFESIEPSTEPFAIFLTSYRNKSLEESVEKKGYYYLNPDNVESLDKVFSNFDRQYVVNKENRINNWNGLSVIAHNCHSIMIYDTYLFKESVKGSRSLFLETISEWLKAILKGSRSENINLLLMIPKTESPKNLDILRNKIQEHLKSRFDKISIQVGIVRLTEKVSTHHDRHIFTNFTILNSGDSINYFRGKLNEAIDTTLTSTSLLRIEEFNELLLKLERLKKTIPKKDYNGTEKIRSSDCIIPFQ